MEPERDIEKQLTAFIRKRREQAGDPLELHPATRRLLQNEIAQRTRTQADGTIPLNWLGGLRPWLVYALGGLAIIAVGVALVLPALSPAKSKSKRTSELAENRKKMELDESAQNRPAFAQAPSPVRSGAPAAAPPALEDLAKDSSLPQAADQKSESDGVAIRSRQSSVQPEVALQTAPGVHPAVILSTNAVSTDLAQAANSALAINEPSPKEQPTDRSVSLAGSPPSEIGGLGSGGGRNLVRFTNAIVALTLAGLRDDASRAEASAASPLSSFVVEQNGTNLRVLDSDGSIYSGSVQPQPASAGEGLVAGKVVRSLSPAVVAADDKEVPRLQTNFFFFNVAGTNLTLDRSLVLTGTFSTPGLAGPAPTGTNLDLSGTPGFSTQNRSATVLLWQLPNSQINGTAVIGRSNVLEIHALPAPVPMPR